MDEEKNTAIVTDSKIEKRHAAPIVAFLLILAAGGLPWGTIKFHYTGRFMSYMDHPGLCNRILTEEDLSKTKIGEAVNQTASAWKSGFDLYGFFWPHWTLMVLAFFLFVLSILDDYDFLLIRSSVLTAASLHGLLHVGASALGFFSQGHIRWGLTLTGAGYLVFFISFLRRTA